MKKSTIIISMGLMLFLAIVLPGTCLAQVLDMDNAQVNTDDGTAAQYNEAVAINFHNPDNAVIAWDDMRLGYPRIAIAYTLDGGLSWTDFLPEISAYPSLRDPSVAADTAGNFFVCMIGQDTASQSIGDIIVLRSSNNGISWSEPMIAVAGSPDYHDIMPKIAVDNTPFGSCGFIYVAWVRYEDDISQSLIYSTQSDNHGQSFLPPVQVSDYPGALHPNINVRSAFGNGDVDVNWLQTAPRHAAWDFSVTEAWTFHNDTWLTVSCPYDYEINGGIFVSTIMVETGDNQIGSTGYEKAYMVYMDDSSSDMEIRFSRIVSYFDITEFVDFSPRIRLNDDELGNGADQFMPTVAIDETGTVHVVFLDRRGDPNNLLYDVYYTSSSDLGYTWSPNVRVTTVSSDPSQPNVAGQIGNRIGIAARGGHVYITWTDCRNGNTDVYASRMLETAITEQPTPLPSDISLDNLYPNPFNSSVEISYSANSVQHVSLDVIDLLGRHITNLFDGNCQAGSNRIIWNGKSADGQDVSSGVYFVRLNANGQTLLKKAVLLR